MNEDFDFDKALKALQSGKAITGKDGVLTPLIKKLTEASLEAELDSHLAQDVVPNHKNGKTRKTVKSTAGPFELETPRDRAGNFEPQLIKKHQTSVNEEIEAKILAMYGLPVCQPDPIQHVIGIT
jgi:putative transposase